LKPLTPAPQLSVLFFRMSVWQHLNSLFIYRPMVAASLDFFFSLQYYSRNSSMPLCFGFQQFGNSKANRSSISEFLARQKQQVQCNEPMTFHSFACMLSQWYYVLQSFCLFEQCRLIIASLTFRYYFNYYCANSILFSWQ
jgi:hypothetical protein